MSAGVDFGEDCILNTKPCRKDLCIGTSEYDTREVLDIKSLFQNNETKDNFTLVATMNSHGAIGGTNNQLISWGNFW